MIAIDTSATAAAATASSTADANATAALIGWRHLVSPSSCPVVVVSYVASIVSTSISRY